MPVKSEEAIRARITELGEELKEIDSNPHLTRELRNLNRDSINEEIMVLSWVLGEESGLSV